MPDRPTPICPRTIGPDHDGRPCPHGSNCAAWVPEYRDSEGGLSYCPILKSGDFFNQDLPRLERTGRGRCAENLRRPPWLDPASNP